MHDGATEDDPASDAASPEDVENKPRDFVTSLVHGLSVLKAFDSEHPSMSLSQVAEITHMSRAGARRYLLTLEHLGYLVRTGRNFRPTPKVLELGYTYLSSVPFPDLMQSMLDEVSQTTGQTSAMAIRDGGEAVYIARSPGTRLLSVSVPVGRRLPMISTSTGRAMLAFESPAEVERQIKQSRPMRLTNMTTLDAEVVRRELTLVRERGYALVEQEVEVGVRSLAVPIFDKTGKVVAAVTALTSMGAVSVEQLLADVLPMIKHVAEQVETAFKAGLALPKTQAN